MSTEKLTETTAAGTSPADYARFVAAVRYLRRNGWTYDRTDMGGMRDYRWRKDTTAVNYVVQDGGTTLYLGASGPNYWVLSIQIENPTGRQAIDYLVVAGVLPTEFASTACTYCEVSR